MKNAAFLFLVLILNLPVHKSMGNTAFEKDTQNETTLSGKVRANKGNKPDNDIVEKIIQSGGVMIYSIQFDSTMSSTIEKGKTSYPSQFTSASSAIYHYFLNESLYFKICQGEVEDSTQTKIIDCMVIDIDCPGTDIFGCTYHCRGTENGETIGIASDPSGKSIMVMVNNVTEGFSVVFKTESENIIKYK